ncbi:MAG: hypothetical protein GTO08_11505 [Deltaproteobacteria bacterium]|nr:hypothetical protein [Deltaproteobacteria bacterium]
MNQQIFKRAGEYLDVLGFYDDVFVGHSNCRQIREGSGSGGIVTQVLSSLLREGYLKKALVAGMSSTEPWKGKSVLAESKKDVVECSQSKYTIIPQMDKLGAIVDSSDNVAIVGLPCHIHAFRKYQAKFPERLENVKLLIGLFCHMALEIDGTLKMVERAKVQRDQLSKIEYRGGEWPGKVRVFLKNGDIIPLHSADFKDGAINYLKYLYYPPRCLTCIDFSAEFSDLSVGDPWIRKRDGKYLYQGGDSLVMTRTKQGKDIIDMVKKMGDITAEPIDENLLKPRFQGMIKYKKIGAQIRVEKLKKRGLPHPIYHYSLPKPDYLNVLREKTHAASRFLGKSELGRNFGSLIAFSWMGDRLTVIRRLRKEFSARLK